ncbi:hypothetical protein FQR65_LT19176 [Abscondita terminalis]|nr:hypothetical protein FQR65_LT19176 [Abscondita terminalis]
MEGTLNQPCRVQEDCPMGCKLLLSGNKPTFANVAECTRRIRIRRTRPAAAVNGVSKRLSGFIGFKGTPIAKAAFQAFIDADARKRGDRTGLDTLVVHALNDDNSMLAIDSQRPSESVKLSTWGVRPQG